MLRNTRQLIVVVLLMAGPMPMLLAQNSTVQATDGKRGGEVPPSSEVRQLPEPQLQTREPRYEVCPGDVLELAFSFSPEFNQTVTVQPDGYIVLREIGQAYVQGKTVAEIRNLAISAYGQILRQPVVTVVLKEFEKPHFIVGGQVAKPGKYELRADTTALEAIAIAGGFTSAAKHSQVLLFRRVSQDWFEVKNLDIKKLQKGNALEDVHLRPGDMLVVPQNVISKIKQYLPTTAVGAYLSPTTF
jgi:polysaccharide export outer membrane protein